MYVFPVFAGVSFWVVRFAEGLTGIWPCLPSGWPIRLTAFPALDFVSRQPLAISSIVDDMLYQLLAPDRAHGAVVSTVFFFQPFSLFGGLRDSPPAR